MQRILNLPTVDPTEAEQAALADTWTKRLRRRDDAPPLRPIQGYALQSAYEQRAPLGLFCPIGVGHGKTLITLLLGSVWNSVKPLLLVPPDLKRPTEVAITYWGKYYRFPRPTLLSYNVLSRPEQSGILERLRPDLIIMDEAQALRKDTSSRTKRLSRYLKGEKAVSRGNVRTPGTPGHPDTRVVALSGSFTSASIHDYAHILEWCLRDSSPLPLSDVALELWGNVLDAAGMPGQQAYDACMPLARFAEPNDLADDTESDRLAIRQGYSNRVRSAPGVVATTESSAAVALTITLAPREVPDAVTEALSHLSTAWETPDGTEIVDSLAFHRCAKQLAAGFYHVVEWPNNEPDREWLEARSGWAKVIREELRGDAREGYDSPALVMRAAQAKAVSGPALRAWNRWAAVRERHGRLGPPTRAVWIDKEIIYQTLDALLGAPPTILWYQSKAVETELAAHGLRTFGAGTLPPGHGCQHDNCDCASKVVYPACSVYVHHKGKNLQPWSHNLIIEPPGNGATWEQLLGRTHRSGQTADVHARIWSDPWPYDAAMVKARREALYAEQTTGARQKLNLATWSYDNG